MQSRYSCSLHLQGTSRCGTNGNVVIGNQHGRGIGLLQRHDSHRRQSGAARRPPVRRQGCTKRLTDLGISVNNDGSLTYNAESLDSLLNTDFSGVAGFFQNNNSWGQSFSTMLTNAGTSSPTGILSLASSSNSSIESSLNAEISKEQTYISAQQSSLTTELNSANEIMQAIPTQLQGVNGIGLAQKGSQIGLMAGIRHQF